MVSHSGRGTSTGLLVHYKALTQIKSKYGEHEAYKEDCGCKNQRHAYRMDPDIGGIVVIRPILLLISNTSRAICGQCLLTKQSCFSRLRDIAGAGRGLVTMCSRQVKY